MNTVIQAPTATGKSPKPKKAIARATMRAIIPEIGDCVAPIMDGKVITAKVTYGT